jgi:hypothetical protein
VAAECKPGAGKAAVDEVRVLLDVAQAPAEGAFEVVVVGKGNIGQRAAPYQ